MRHSKRQQMAQDAAQRRRNKTTRRWAFVQGVMALLSAATLAYGGYQALVHPDTPLPREWNPTKALVISDPVTPLTGWKLARAAADPETCVATLEGYAALDVLEPLEDSTQCFISDRVALRQVGQSRLSPVETRCAIALRTAMWERHSLQPAAIDLLGAPIARISHIGSYNCRRLRSSSGTSTRMSTHATANAIDIAGFDLADGTRIRLLEDWEQPGAKSAFLRAARDGACEWFRLTLSPDYNRLHADHFHLQATGWGLCR